MNRIKELCMRRGINQKQVALKIGVSQPTVSDWFNQKKNPRGERLEKLCSLLDVTEAAILGYNVDLLSMKNEPLQNSSVKSVEREKLTADELTLLRCYGVLNEMERKELLDYLKFKTWTR